MARTQIMGILNVTPDSFSDGGRFLNPDVAVRHALQLVQDGADIIDVGGESSRPGADRVSVDEELKRVIPVIARLSRLIEVPISIDTTKPEVAQAALNAGASIVNDISGLSDPSMIQVASKSGAAVVIMHMKGSPKTMQENPQYDDVVKEVRDFFKERIKKARDAGIDDIILDPGIGFGKKLEHNLELLRNIGEFTKLGYPVLVGPSRKSFIGAILGGLQPHERLEGTLASIAMCALQGASIVRVHDVKEARRALDVLDAIKGDKQWTA